MIPEIGQFALILALLLAITQASIPMIGAARGNRSWMAVAAPAGQAQFILVAIAFSCLAYSFITNDFSVLNVATNSNSHLPLQYRMDATLIRCSRTRRWSRIRRCFTWATSVFQWPLPSRSRP